MVGHQDVGVNLKPVALAVMFNSLQVVKPVSIVPKDLLSLIAPDNHVIKRPFEFHPRFPGHATEHNRRLADKSILRPDPFVCDFCLLTLLFAFVTIPTLLPHSKIGNQ